MHRIRNLQKLGSINISLSQWHRPLLEVYTAQNSCERFQQWEENNAILPSNECVCRACGNGGNTIGHWTRWCPVPLIVALAILRPEYDNLDQLATTSSRSAAVCTLVIVNFRRLLRQEGAFLHQTTAEAKHVLWWIQQLQADVAKEAHIELGVKFPLPRTPIQGCIVNVEGIELKG